VDLPFGRVQLKRGGGHGGHNGLRNIASLLGGNGFTRVRVGVSRPPEGWQTADYVLGKWNDQEASELDGVVDKAADAVEAVLREGVAVAMNKVNRRPSQKNKPSKPDQSRVSDADSGIVKD
jgi:PTH1 family peptidyl-tRNA hydrolase